MGDMDIRDPWDDPWGDPREQQIDRRRLAEEEEQRRARDTVERYLRTTSLSSLHTRHGIILDEHRVISFFREGDRAQWFRMTLDGVVSPHGQTLDDLVDELATRLEKQSIDVVTEASNVLVKLSNRINEVVQKELERRGE